MSGKLYVIKYKVNGFGFFKDEEHTLVFEGDKSRLFKDKYRDLKAKLNVKDIKAYESMEFKEVEID